MALDYVIDFACVPKEQLTTPGLMARLKAHHRAQALIEMHRRDGDHRPPRELDFEFTRRTGDGHETTSTLTVQHLLDEAADLGPLQHHCQGCPANRTGGSFGCVGFIDYPISAAGETWLLQQLPDMQEVLPWLLLKDGLEVFQYDGQTVAPLRLDPTYFEARVPAFRNLGEFVVNANQIFEMVFMVGDVNPNHAAILMLFFKAIPRDLPAERITGLSRMSADPDGLPFQHITRDDDENTIRQLKEFLQALYLAWTLDVLLGVDP
jgi:hypothetical protein